jgi:hypothetical protein
MFFTVLKPLSYHHLIIECVPYKQCSLMQLQPSHLQVDWMFVSFGSR